LQVSELAEAPVLDVLIGLVHLVRAKANDKVGKRLHIEEAAKDNPKKQIPRAAPR
jgi:hypothetical protein